MNIGGAAAIVAIALSATATEATAQDTQRYNLVEQDLATALRAFAAASGREVIAPSAIISGKRSTAVNGTLSAERAIAQLLGGTGLRADLVEGAFVIRVAARPAEPRDQSSVGADDIIVTGSRIRGAPVASPVITLSQAAIRDTGQSNLGDVARSIPQSFGGGQNPGNGFNVPTAIGGNVGSGSSVNLRGLGSDATLTLLNGRRMPYSASRQSIDISAVPLAAVDRIEVVADGSSALYGSDAVAGVVNIILLRDFEGFETRARLGASTDGGNFQQQYGALGGLRWASGGFFATYEFDRTTAITAEDRDYASGRPGVTLLPGTKRHAIAASGHQDLGDTLTIDLDGFANSRRSATTYPLNFAGDLAISRTTQSFAADTYALASSATLSLGPWRAALTGTFGEDQTDFSGDTYFGGVLASTQSGRYSNRSLSAELSADGPLLALPGGAAKLAAGIGLRANDFALFRGVGAPQNVDAAQDSVFGYAELSVPVISPDARLPFVHRLNLSAAVRYERYKGIGDVATPKVGVIYAPNADIDLKASWGKSFRAPTFIQQYGIRQALLTPVTSLGGTGYPAGSTALLVLGGSADLKPERATSWSATVALHPQWFPDARLEISYFSTKYVDRIVNPIPIRGRALVDPAFVGLLTLNPTAAQQSALIAGADEFIDGTTAGYDPSLVAVLVNSANTNAGRQSIHGIDALFDYTNDVGGLAGVLGLTLNASYLESEQQLFERQPIQQLAGLIFNPPHFRGRGTLSSTRDGLTLAATASHIGKVEDNRQNPPVSISGMTTLDLSGRYRFDRGALDGLEISLAVQNLFNDKPAPLATTLFFDTPYDSTNYSPVGRFVSVSIAKTW